MAFHGQQQPLGGKAVAGTSDAGASAMTAPRIHLSAPDIGPVEEEYLIRALRSGWVAPVGPELDAFEREMAVRVGVTHAVALSSGTAALHLALVALDVRPHDVVVVPTLTFAATANAVLYTGAEPAFVDCDPRTGNIDISLLAESLRSLRRMGRRVAAVIPVDIFGLCADYTNLLPLCTQAGVAVVEDAAEALGARHADRMAGSFGSAGILSFNGNKIMTTSGGGMLLSDDSALVARCRYLAAQARQPVIHYEHTEVGYNYRLSNLLAAIGRAQLRRLDTMINRRRTLRDRYAKLFASSAGVRLLGSEQDGSNFWLTAIIVDASEAGWHVGQLAAYLENRAIETRPVWKPLHLQPMHARRMATVTGAAQRLFERGLTLPSGSAITDQQFDRIAEAITTFLGRS